MSGGKKTMVRSTAAQIRHLINYMGQHPSFAAGEFQGPLGSGKHEAQWAQMKEALDELGPSRSIQQWKHCWRDQKKKARQEGGALRKRREQTGNSTIVPELSQGSEIILGTIGHAMATGVGPAESPIGHNEPTTTAGCSQQPTLPSGPQGINMNVGARRRVRRETPPDRFIKAQLEANAMLKEINKKLEEANTLTENYRRRMLRLKVEQNNLLLDANILRREKLKLLRERRNATPE